MEIEAMEQTEELNNAKTKEVGEDESAAEANEKYTTTGNVKALVIYESIDAENSGALAEIKSPNFEIEDTIDEALWSGETDEQMSDSTFNEQENEAVETTAIVPALAPFELHCILFRSSYIGKHVKNNIARSEFEVQANSEVQIAFIFGSVCLKRHFTLDSKGWVQDGIEKANDVTTYDEKMTLDEDAKKKSLSIMNLLGPFMLRRKKMLKRLIKTTKVLRTCWMCM